MSLRVASSAENSTSSVCWRANAHGVGGRFEALLARHAQLGLQVQVGGGDEGVDAPLRGRLDGPRRALQVGAMAPGQARDHRPADLGGNRPHGLGIGGRRNREAGLDDVHAKRVQLPGQLQLLRRVQREPRRLLAVSQRRVEDPHVLLYPSDPLRAPRAAAPPAGLVGSTREPPPGQ